MTKSAKIFFLVYILASVTALIASQMGTTPGKEEKRNDVTLPLTLSALGASTGFNAG